MEKIKLLQTRVFNDNHVYLLASDVAELLGYEIEEFLDIYENIVHDIEDMPPLVLETDFNSILIENEELYDRLQHIEITRVDTLRFETEIQKDVYPLKLMFAKDLFEINAKKAGLSSVQEYIKGIDYPKEISKAFERLKGNINAREHYQKEYDESNNPDILNAMLLKEWGLELQEYTCIRNDSPSYDSYIVGDGIFYQVMADVDEYYTKLRVEHGNIIIPEFDEKKGCLVECNHGCDSTGRDYRNYDVIENIIYILLCKNIKSGGVDLLECTDPGINLYISEQEAFRLLNPNMFRNNLIFGSKIDFETDSYFTEYSGKIQREWESTI